MIRQQTPKALDNAFSELFRILISGVFSVCICSRVILLYTPQEVGHTIRNFLQTTPRLQFTALEKQKVPSATIALQLPFASTLVHNSYILDISYALSYAVLEVCEFVTSACFLTKRSLDFRHSSYNILFFNIPHRHIFKYILYGT